MSIFRDDILDDKVALVTGGGSGINFGIARAFVEHGASVSLVSRTQSKLDDAAEELSSDQSRAKGFAADVREPDAVEAAVDATVDAFGKIDILVNGAAGNFLSPAAQLSPNGFKAVVDIDCNGTFNVSRACFEHLVESSGTIINITANQAWIATPLQVHAGAAKAAVQKMTHDLALEWGPMGIRVVAIAPGPINDTEGVKRLAQGDVREQLESTLPMRRFGEIEEIGQAAVYLCSDAATYITGTTLVVDGGQQLTGPAGLLDVLGM